MIEIELFDGYVLEFPEGTSQDVIDRVAREETMARQSSGSADTAPQDAPAEGAPDTEGLGRQLGLSGRAVAQGGAGLLGIAYDPIAAVQNYIFGTEIEPLRKQVQQALTDMGVPEPETAMERIVQAIGEGAVGAGGQAAIAKGAAGLMSGGGQQVARQMAAMPGAQAAGGAGAGVAQQATAEMGGGAVAQVGAALVGGALGGRAATTTTQSPSSALPQAIRDAEASGVRVMTTDAMPPNTFVGKWMQRTGEMIPGAGTGGPRAAQQQERIDASTDLLRNYGVSEVSSADNSIVASVADDLIKRRGDMLTKYTAMKGDVIEQLGGAGAVDVRRTVAAIDGEIAGLRRLNSKENNPIIDRLDDWKTAITGTREVTMPDGTKRMQAQGQSIPDIELLRKQIGQSFKDPNLTAVRGTGEKALNRIYAPLREDMGDFIKANGQRRDFDKWNVANRQLSNMAGELELGVLKRSLSTGDATPEVIRTMLFSTKPSDVKALYKGLSSEGKRNARTAVLQEAFNKVGGNFENLSPDQFKRQLSRLGSPIGVFFSGQDLKAVDGLVQTLKMTERAGQSAVSPATGVQGVPVIGAAVLTDILGGAGAGIAGGATIGGAARIFESAPVRNLLLKIPQTTTGSPEQLELIKRLGDVIRAEGRTEPKQEPETAQ